MAQPNGITLPIPLRGTARSKTWHTDSDVPLRHIVAEHILQLLHKRRPAKPEWQQDWQEKLLDFVKLLEEALYRLAATKEEYADQQTLESRVQSLAKRIRSENQLARQQHGSQTMSSSTRDVSQSNFMQDTAGPGSSPEGQQALGSMAAQPHRPRSISPKMSKRKQSDVVGLDEGLAEKIQRKHVSELDGFDTPHTAGAAQVDEPNAEEVRDHQNFQESAAGSLQASYQEVVYVSLSPVMKPRAQPFQGELRGGIVNSGFGRNLDTQIVTIEKIAPGRLNKEQPDAFQHSETGLFKQSPWNVTQPAEQAQEGTQSGQGLEIFFESGDFRIDVPSTLVDFFFGEDFCLEDWFQVQQKSLSHEIVNHSNSSFKITPLGIFGGHPHGDSLADQVEYLERVSPQNLICISKQAHKSFLVEEGLDRFASLNWRFWQPYEMEDLHEIIRNYNEQTQTSQWHNHAIDLRDDALAIIFPLPRSNKEPSFKATSFQSKFFPNSAMRRNGFLLSKCNSQRISERLKFLWETLHVKTVTPEIPHYIVRLLEESIPEKNWFGYFIQGFRKELKKGKTRKKLQLGSHLSLVLAAQAPLGAKVEGAASGEETTDSKTILFKCDDNKAEIQIMQDEGQTLQAEGQASGAEDLTQEKEERECTLLISQCAANNDPSTSINDMKDEGQTLQAEGQPLGAEDLSQEKDERDGTLLISQRDSRDYPSTTINDPVTSVTNVRNSLEALEKDIKVTQSQKHRLENQLNILRNENHRLCAEKEELVATHQRQKEDLLTEFRRKEKQLEEDYVEKFTKDKVKVSSAIERHLKWVLTELEKIQEAKKKDLEDMQVLLKEQKKVNEKHAMVEGLFDQVKSSKTQLDAVWKEMDEKKEADRAELEACCKKKDDKLKLKLKANRAKLEGLGNEMDKKLKTSISRFQTEGEQGELYPHSAAGPIYVESNIGGLLASCGLGEPSFGLGEGNNPGPTFDHRHYLFEMWKASEPVLKARILALAANFNKAESSSISSDSGKTFEAGQLATRCLLATAGAAAGKSPAPLEVPWMYTQTNPSTSSTIVPQQHIIQPIQQQQLHSQHQTIPSSQSQQQASTSAALYHSLSSIAVPTWVSQHDNSYDWTMNRDQHHRRDGEALTYEQIFEDGSLTLRL